MDTRTKLRKRTKSLKRKKLVVGLSLTTLGLGTISTIAPNLVGTVHAETLEQLGIDTSRLETAISNADYAYANEHLYTEESFIAFEQAFSEETGINILPEARAFLTRTDFEYDGSAGGVTAYQRFIELYSESIEYALTKLVLKDTNTGYTAEELGIDTTELGALYNQAWQIVTTDQALYTPESYNLFYNKIMYNDEANPNGAFNTADTILRFNTLEESQANSLITARDSAIATFNAALSMLVLKETPTISYELPTYPGIELSNLQTLLDRYNSLNEDDYTPESWTIMHDNLNGVTHTIHTVGVATSIFNQTFPTENVTQELIDLMVSRGNAEMDELILKDTESPQIVSGVLTASSTEVKVGETVTFSYTLTFDDGTTQDAFEYYGYGPSYKYSRTSPNDNGIIEGSTWTPSEPGEYVFYPLAEPGSYATVTVKVVEATNDDGSNNTEKEADNDTNQDNKESDKGAVVTSNDNNTSNSSQTSNPETTDSTAEEKESDKDNKESEKTLPQTGEKSSLGLGIGGLATMLFAVFTWFRRFRKI